MKGVILAGGMGTRLHPLTKVVNKHLLPVYDRPMIFYPIQTLTQSGVDDIMIITGTDHVGGFMQLLGSGVSFDAKFTFRVQEQAGGIAEALSLAKDFIRGESCAVILGDNIFEDSFSEDFLNFTEGAMIFVKEVSDPHRFGVVELDKEKVLSIEEKPKNPKSHWVQTGLYLYDSIVFDIIEQLDPSARGELEIADVNNEYLRKGSLQATKVQKEWTDAGTFSSLLSANMFASTVSKIHEKGDPLLITHPHKDS